MSTSTPTTPPQPPPQPSKHKVRLLRTTATVTETICLLPIITSIASISVTVKTHRFVKEYERPAKTARKARIREQREWRSTVPRPVKERGEGWGDGLSVCGSVGGVCGGEGEEGEGNGNGERISDDGKGKRLTVEQRDSPLSKLPPEVRRQVWEEVLGEYVFHIRFLEAYRKMGHVRCKTRYPEVCKERECRMRSKIRGAEDEWGVVDLLALLRTCRWI